MLLHHRHQTWTFLLDKNGRSSNIEWMLGLDINRTWLFLHHSVKGGSSDYTQWSLLCAPATLMLDPLEIESAKKSLKLFLEIRKGILTMY